MTTSKTPAGKVVAVRGVVIEGGWKIQAKQVNLIDCDQAIQNASIIF